MSSSNQEPKKEPSHFGDGFFQFIMNNKWDTFSYIVLFIGLIFSIFERFIGGLFVGAILGIYFSQEIRSWFIECRTLIIEEGVFRAFILIAAGVALFIASPGLCIGAGIGAYGKVLIKKIFPSLMEK